MVKEYDNEVANKLDHAINFMQMELEEDDEPTRRTHYKIAILAMETLLNMLLLFEKEK